MSFDEIEVGSTITTEEADTHSIPTQQNQSTLIDQIKTTINKQYNK